MFHLQCFPLHWKKTVFFTAVLIYSTSKKGNSEGASAYIFEDGGNPLGPPGAAARWTADRRLPKQYINLQQAISSYKVSNFIDSKLTSGLHLILIPIGIEHNSVLLDLCSEKRMKYYVTRWKGNNLMNNILPMMMSSSETEPRLPHLSLASTKKVFPI